MLLSLFLFVQCTRFLGEILDLVRVFLVHIFEVCIVVVFVCFCVCVVVVVFLGGGVYLLLLSVFCCCFFLLFCSFVI